MRLLLVPACGPGLGSGHLRRCLALARRWDGEAALLLEGCRERCGRGARELLEPLAGGEPLPAILQEYDPQEPWSWCSWTASACRHPRWSASREPR